MANALYAKGREGFLDGSIDWDTNDIKAQILDSGVYTADLANDTFVDPATLAGEISRSPNFGGKTVTDGVADANDVVFTAVTGAQSEYVSIFADSGLDTTSRLIALIDTATGLPITPNGGDITVAWDNGANKIFKL